MTELIREKNKTCRALTKKNTNCSRPPWLFWYCKQHWKIKIFSWWGLIWGLIVGLGIVFGFFVDGKEIVGEIKTATRPEPDYWVCEQDGNIRGILLSGVDKVGNNTIDFRFGEPPNALYYPMKIDESPFCLFNAFGVFNEGCTISFRINNDNRLLVSMDIYDLEGCLVAKIEDGEFVLNSDCMFTWNRDEFAFELVDDSYNVVFSMEYNLSNYIVVKGIVTGLSQTLVFYEQGAFKAMNDDVDRQSYLKNGINRINPIFKYTGPDWFGKRNSSQ